MKSGFDSETSVFVRGIGFETISKVREGLEIATLDGLTWSWGTTSGVERFESSKIAKLEGSGTDVVCSGTQPLLAYDGGGDRRVLANDHDMINALHGCEWFGNDTHDFKFGHHNLDAEPFLTVVAAFLSGGELGEGKITLIDADEATMEAIRGLDLQHEIIGSYVDIVVPNTLQWFFSLLNVEGERRLITKLKSMRPEYLHLLWRPFENKVIKQKRFKSDLVEIVIKSGYTPMFVNNRLFTENRISSPCCITIVNEPTILTNIETKSGPILTERNGKLTWVYTR